MQYFEKLVEFRDNTSVTFIITAIYTIEQLAFHLCICSVFGIGDLRCYFYLKWSHKHSCVVKCVVDALDKSHSTLRDFQRDCSSDVVAAM